MTRGVGVPSPGFPFGPGPERAPLKGCGATEPGPDAVW